MPHTGDVSVNALDVVVSEVGRTLPRLLGAALPPQAVIAINASFMVWKLSSEQVTGKDSTDLSLLATDTGRWHHQIVVDGEPMAYARAAFTNGHWIVDEVTVSTTAEDLDNAIDWVDANVHSNDLTRLLEAPAYDLRALWLVGSGRVVVAQAARLLSGLEQRTLIAQEDLLAQLRAVEPIVGVGLG